MAEITATQTPTICISSPSIDSKTEVHTTTLDKSSIDSEIIYQTEAMEYMIQEAICDNHYELDEDDFGVDCVSDQQSVGIEEYELE